MGLQQTEDWGSDELNARYFTGRKDALKLRSNLGRLMNART